MEQGLGSEIYITIDNRFLNRWHIIKIVPNAIYYYRANTRSAHTWHKFNPILDFLHALALQALRAWVH